MSAPTADELVNEIASRMIRLLHEAGRPFVAGSPGALELASLRGTRGGGGRARADLLEELLDDSIHIIGNMTLYVMGVADCFAAAACRRNEVNRPALSVAVRPVVELAGVSLWLLDNDADADTRVRRYLMWRFREHREQRLSRKRFALGNELGAGGTGDLERQETALLARVSACRWTGRPVVVKQNGDVETAALLKTVDGKVERMPSIDELVQRVASNASLYALLSFSAHGHIFAARKVIGEDMTVKLSGSGLPPESVLVLLCLAAWKASEALGTWTGVDAGQVIQCTTALAKRLDV